MGFLRGSECSVSGRDRQCGHSWDCCSLPRSQSLCTFYPLPSLSLPSPLITPCASTTRRLHPSFHSQTSHTSVPLHNPVLGLDTFCLCLCGLVSATRKCHLHGPARTAPMPPHHSSLGGWPLAFPVPFVFRLPDLLQSLSTKYKLPQALPFSKVAPLPAFISAHLERTRASRRGAWSPPSLPSTPWPLGCPGKGTFQKCNLMASILSLPISSRLLQPPGLSPHSSARCKAFHDQDLGKSNPLLPPSTVPGLRAKPNCSEGPSTWATYVSTHVFLCLCSWCFACLLHSATSTPALRVLLLPPGAVRVQSLRSACNFRAAFACCWLPKPPDT